MIAEYQDKERTIYQTKIKLFITTIVTKIKI
jgi:hypothetical protein